jgi:hypothetical protein
MNELSMQRCEVILYILDQVKYDIYHMIQFFGNLKISKLYLFYIHETITVLVSRAQKYIWKLYEI